jgi:hypothetical protein
MRWLKPLLPTIFIQCGARRLLRDWSDRFSDEMAKAITPYQFSFIAVRRGAFHLLRGWSDRFSDEMAKAITPNNLHSWRRESSPLSYRFKQNDGRSHSHIQRFCPCLHRDRN